MKFIYLMMHLFHLIDPFKQHIIRSCQKCGTKKGFWLRLGQENFVVPDADLCILASKSVNFSWSWDFEIFWKPHVRWDLFSWDLAPYDISMWNEVGIRFPETFDLSGFTRCGLHKGGIPVDRTCGPDRQTPPAAETCQIYIMRTKTRLDHKHLDFVGYHSGRELGHSYPHIGKVRDRSLNARPTKVRQKQGLWTLEPGLKLSEVKLWCNDVPEKEDKKEFTPLRHCTVAAAAYDTTIISTECWFKLHLDLRESHTSYLSLFYTDTFWGL